MPRWKDKNPRKFHNLWIKSRISDGSQAKEWFKSYYLKNKDKILAANKAWRNEAKKNWWKPRGQQNYRIMAVSLLLQRDWNKCGICWEELDILTCQIDHIVPYNVSKDDGAKNLQLSHPNCNYSKKRK